MPDTANYALPLFALVDREKVDLASPMLPELAEQLQRFFASRFDLESLDARIEVLAKEPYFVLNGVPPSGLAKLFALADVQSAQLFSYRRDSAEEATLTPLAVKPEGT